MSTFSRFIGGNGIKSIQRGTYVIANGAFSGTISISPVDPNKAELRLLGFNTSSDIAAVPLIYLSSNSTITAKRSTSVSQTEVSWEVTEFI